MQRLIAMVYAVVVFRAMRGPLLSGALGSAATLEAMLRLVRGAEPVVVLGPPWLGVTLSAELPVLMLVGAQERATVRRVRRRAHKAGRRLEIAIGGDEAPLRAGSVGAMIIENVVGLAADAATRWIAALAPCLRPGGRLVAADATGSAAAMARVSGAFLAAALIGLAQEHPRDGVVLTTAEAPDGRVMAGRFAGDTARA
jgi:hypothetical protein